jgi:hypothetical protein
MSYLSLCLPILYTRYEAVPGVYPAVDPAGWPGAGGEEYHQGALSHWEGSPQVRDIPLSKILTFVRMALLAVLNKNGTPVDKTNRLGFAIRGRIIHTNFFSGEKIHF